MPTDYSPLDALPAPQGGDIVRVSAFTDLRAAIDGKLVLTCTSATRPTGTARFTGRLIYETDTLMWRTWTGARWAWTGGAPEIRALTLPSVAAVASAYVTFPTTAGGTIAAQTNDPDGALVVITTAGSQGIQCRDAGVYEAWADMRATVNSANALVVLFLPGAQFAYAAAIFGPSGATTIGAATFTAAAGETVIPKVYTYSGTQSYSGTLYVRKVGEK